MVAIGVMVRADVRNFVSVGKYSGAIVAGACVGQPLAVIQFEGSVTQTYLLFEKKWFVGH